MNENKNVIIWGASGHAMVVTDVLTLGGYSIKGYIDDININRKGTAFLVSTILGGKEVLDYLLNSEINTIALAIGDNAARLVIGQRVRDMGFTVIRAIHPQAIISVSSNIGAGTMIAAGAIINPYCEIGQDVIINTAASIDHECNICDGVHIAPGAHLAGRVNVGKKTLVGVGSSVKEGVSIGSETIVGAGSVVTKDIPQRMLVYGVPAKIIRSL